MNRIPLFKFEETKYILLKESGRIRRRFGRNVGILKRLKIFRRFKRIFDCYSFSSILEYGKIGKILLKCISFIQNMILNKAIRSISYDNRQILLCFKRILLSLGLVSTKLKCVTDAFFKNEFTASIKKNGEMTQRYPKSYFSDLFFGLKIC